MDAQDRFERRSLRDVLIAQGILSTELADELISSARETHEPFGAVVVDAGHMTSWDLAKTIAMHYQLPYVPLGGFQYDKVLDEGLSPSTLYQYQMVPVGRFGSVRSFAVIEPPSRDCITALKDVCGNNLFFFVAEVPDVQRILRENVKVVDTKADTAWQSIFDTGDKNVLHETDILPGEGE